MEVPMQLHVFFGTLREHYILLFGAAGTFALATGFVGAWVGSWVGAKRALRAVDLSRPAGDAAQLATMMQAIDAISVEVERISEAQRFTSRLLSERPPVSMPASRSEPRSITPH